MEDVQEQLEWEARQRPRAAAAAIAAAALTIGATIYSVSIFSDAPRASVLDSLERVAQPGPLGPQTTLHLPLYEWFDRHFGELLAAAALSAAGLLATAGALTFLAFATGARRREFPRIGLYLPIVGGVLMALGAVLVAFGRDALVSDFLSGEQTVDRFANESASTLATAGQMVELVGRVTLASAFIVVCLNAMRAGLLTRFFGVLGVIAGVLLVLPIGSPLPVVQTFWLLGVGLLFLGRVPGGAPPAWRTGTAIPWPTGAELREARQQQQRQAADEGPEKPEKPRTDAPSPATSARKKRKRRR